MSQQDSLWSDDKQAKEILKEQSELQNIIKQYENISSLLEDTKAALELAREAQDANSLKKQLKVPWPVNRP